jgi:hypothetical protein
LFVTHVEKKKKKKKKVSIDLQKTMGAGYQKWLGVKRINVQARRCWKTHGDSTTELHADAMYARHMTQAMPRDALRCVVVVPGAANKWIEGVKRNKFPEHLFLLTPSIILVSTQTDVHVPVCTAAQPDMA